jgi:hypothetical protein
VTAPSIISDAEARGIARHPPSTPKSPRGIFAETGEITERMVRCAESRLGGGPPHELEADHEARPFYTYIANHGERGPQDGWGER